MDRLNAELEEKEKLIGTKEEEMAHIDNEIDANFDDMEALEQQIDEKNNRIRELENLHEEPKQTITLCRNICKFQNTGRSCIR